MIRLPDVLHPRFTPNRAASLVEAPLPAEGLEIAHLSVQFALGEGGLLRKKQGTIHAVSDVSLQVGKGQSVGIIGESGSGKSTLGRAVLHLVRPTSGRIVFDGVSLTNLPELDLRAYRKRMQMVFQDPFDSMNPRMTIGDIVMEPLVLQRLGSRAERRARAAALLDRMGLPAAAMHHYPGQYSGGQRQRVAIARALATHPDLLVLDEPTSGLDVSMQARILNLLRDIQEEFGLSYLFISHDLGAVAYLTQHVHVMYLGRVVESAPTQVLVERPAHPYTASLLDALPPFVRGTVSTRLPMPSGEPPSPTNPPPGCAFHTRCPQAQPTCVAQRPELRELASGQRVACHFPLVSIMPDSDARREHTVDAS